MISGSGSEMDGAGSLSRRPKALLIVGSVLALVSVIAPSILWRVPAPWFHNKVAEITLLAATGLLVAAVCLMAGACIRLARCRCASEILPVRGRRQVVLIAVWASFLIFMNTRLDITASDDGLVEKYYGWPAPVAAHAALYSGREGNPVFCCSRDGGFSLDHFRAHPGLYSGGERARWEIMWWLLPPNLIFMFAGAVVLAHAAGAAGNRKRALGDIEARGEK